MNKANNRGGLCSPGDNQGNALVLAVLISLALTSVGVVSMQRTGMDLKVTGNLSRAVRAHSAGEAGLGHGLAQVGAAPDFFVNTIEQTKIAALDANDSETGARIFVWGCGGYSTTLPAAAAECRIPHVFHDAAARIRQDVAYRVEIVAVPNGEIHDSSGYGLGSEVCLHLFDFNAVGGIPTSFGETVPETMGDATGQADTVIVKSRTRAAVGPGKCQY